MHSNAFLPRTVGVVGTSLHPRNVIPSFSTMISNIFFAWRSLNSSFGKKNIPIPYSLSFPILILAALQALLKNLWEIWSMIPTPSPVSPAASLPARCSNVSTIFNALSTVWWFLTPLIFTQAPIPQLSCSKLGSYNPGIWFVCFISIHPFSMYCLVFFLIIPKFSLVVKYEFS